jgi:hypothetical protein
MGNTDNDRVDGGAMGKSDGDGWRRMSMTFNEGVSERDEDEGK